MCPCVLDPSLRADGITKPLDHELFARCVERCRHYNIEVVPLPCPETLYLGRKRAPGSFLDRLNTREFTGLLDEQEAQVRSLIGERGEPPLCIVGVDSSPTCGVNATFHGEERQPGRGVFLSRFPDIRAYDVETFGAWRVYLAAPLFSEAEQSYNLVLHELLTRHLFEVYLPQEVGDTRHTRALDEHRAIFDQHIEALNEAHIVVAVIDGADADSGTSWEMGYAFARGTRVVALRTDFRHAGHHERVNLMLEQSSAVVASRDDLPGALNSPLI